MFQKMSLTGFFTGLVAFIGAASEVVHEHTQWNDFLTPFGVLHILVIGAAFVVMIAGALGVQLPRNENTNYGDRRTDPKPPAN
jgi:hypothetical protein